MHYVFLDERIQNDLCIFPAVVVPQGLYNDAIKSSNFSGSKNRLKQIEQFLISVNGFACLGYFSKQQDRWLEQKSQDACRDISKMSRADLIWSWGVAYSIESALIMAEKKREVFSSIDLFHDPKTLSPELRDALHGSLRNQMTRTFETESKKFGYGAGLRQAKIRRIVSVPKANDSLALPDKFRRGVWLADQVARNFDKIKNNPSAHIQVFDLSKYVLLNVRDWQRGLVPNPIG